MEGDLHWVESLAKRVKSEAKLCRGSFMKRRDSIGEWNEPLRTLLGTGKNVDVAFNSNRYIYIKQLDKKLKMSLLKDGVKP